jgi:signal transduction histidine kinase
MIGLEAAFRRHGWEQSIPAVKNYTYLIRQAINRLVADKGSLKFSAILHHRKGQSDGVGSIVDSIESIDAILDNVGPAGRDAAAQEKTDINVHNWLTEVQARWKALRGETLISLAIHVDYHESIFGNSYLLTKALDNLIHNAVTAANKTANGKPSVAIECRMTEATILRIEVMDNGPGIPEQIRPLLFNSPIPRELIKDGGHGIGGLLTGFIAQTYGGSCFIESPDSEHWTTRVVMKLPVLGK